MKRWAPLDDLCRALLQIIYIVDAIFSFLSNALLHIDRSFNFFFPQGSFLLVNKFRLMSLLCGGRAEDSKQETTALALADAVRTVAATCQFAVSNFEQCLALLRQVCDRGTLSAYCSYIEGILLKHSWQNNFGGNKYTFIMTRFWRHL